MKQLKLILIFAVLFVVASSLWAETNNKSTTFVPSFFEQQPQVAENYRKTSENLERFGFSSDFVNQIENRRLNKSLPEPTKALLGLDQQRFALLDMSREVAAYTLARWLERPDGENKQKDLHSLIKKFLKSKLVALPQLAAEPGMTVDEALKRKISEVVDLDLKAQILDVLTTALGQSELERKLTIGLGNTQNPGSPAEDNNGDSSGTTNNSKARNKLGDPEVAWVSQLLTRYQQIRYQLLDVALTPYLGRALLIATMAHYEKENRQEAIRTLNQELLADAQLKADAYDLLVAKINEKELRPGDLIASWSDRIAEYYAKNQKSASMPTTLRSFLGPHKALEKNDYNNFATLVCLPTPADCTAPSLPKRLKIHWLVQGPVLPSGGLRMVDLEGFAPRGSSPSLAQIKFTVDESPWLYRSTSIYRQAQIGDFLHGTLLDATNPASRFTTLSVALALSPLDPRKINAQNTKIIGDQSRYQVNLNLLDNTYTSDTWVPTLRKSYFSSLVIPTINIAPQALEMIKTMPRLKMTIEQMQDASKNPQLVRATINCQPLSTPVATSPEQIKEYLYQLGFGDRYNGVWMSHADISEKYREQNITYNTMTQNQQVRNFKDFKKVQASVELATMMAMNLSACEFNDTFIRRVAAMIGTITSFEAPAAQTENPLYTQGVEEGGQDASAHRALYVRALREKMSSETLKLIKLIVDSLYGKDALRLSRDPQFQTQLLRIQEHATSIMELAFMNHQIGRTRYLGRALMAVFLYEAKRLGKYDQAWASLAEVLKSHELAIENFIGDRWRIRTVDKSSRVVDQSVDIYNFSYVFTRGVNMESPTIPAGAIPGGNQMATAENPSAYYIGRRMGLIGQFSAAALVPTPESSFNVVESWKDKKFYNTFNDGFSHIGFAVVRESGGIKMSWLIDNYPTPTADNELDMPGVAYNPGGIRLSGLEQYYRIDHHSRIAIANRVNFLDPNTPNISDRDYLKFFEYAKKQVKAFIDNNFTFERNGDALYFPAHPDFAVYSPVLDPKTGKPLTNKQVNTAFAVDPWKIEITPQQFMEMHKLIFDSIKDGTTPRRDQVKAWFDQVNKAALDKIFDLMYKGVIFVWITPYGQYFKGGAYCSLTGVLGWKLGTGLELQEEKDEWHSIVKTVSREKNLLISQAGGSADIINQIENIAMLPSMPIVAPSGLAAQVYNRVEDVRSFVPPYRELWYRYQLLFGKEIEIQVAPETEQLVNQLALTTEDYFEKVELDPTEVEAIYQDTLEMTIAARGCSQRNSVCGQDLKVPRRH